MLIDVHCLPALMTITGIMLTDVLITAFAISHLFTYKQGKADEKSLTPSGESGLRVSENRVLGRIFGAKRYEVTAEWKTLHNEELYDLYSSLNIVRVIKSRRMRLAMYVARMGRRKVHRGFWC